MLYIYKYLNIYIMTIGTIILYISKYLNNIYKYLNNIYSYLFNNIPLSSDIPSPHKFCSMDLKSSGTNSKSIQELILERKSIVRELKRSTAEHNSIIDELRNLRKAEDLDKMLSDKTKNREMNKIMEFHESFFDEDSGNTREDGIEQLRAYWIEEKKGYYKDHLDLKKKIKDLDEELDKKKAAKKAAEENENTFIPIIPMYSPIVFRIFLTIFSFCIYFKLIDFNLNYLIFHLPDVTIPTTIISIVWFVWEYYRLYSKGRKYYKVGKTIYMFCKKKTYSFYNKISSFYKKL